MREKKRFLHFVYDNHDEKNNLHAIYNNKRSNEKRNIIIKAAYGTNVSITR